MESFELIPLLILNVKGAIPPVGLIFKVPLGVRHSEFWVAMAVAESVDSKFSIATSSVSEHFLESKATIE